MSMHDVTGGGQTSQRPEVAKCSNPPGGPWPPQSHRPEVEVRRGERMGHHHDVHATIAQVRTELGGMGSDAAGAAAKDHDHLHRALLGSLAITSRADSRSAIQI